MEKLLIQIKLLVLNLYKKILMEFDKFSFSLLKSSDNSRLGIINTPRGR